MRSLGFLLLLSVVLVAASPPGDEDGMVSVSGRLVDAAGQPMSGAKAATYWNLKGSKAYAFEALVSDDTGAFSGQIRAWRFPVGLAAYSEDGSLAGYAMVEQDGLESIEIVLRPSVTVTAEVTCEGLGSTPQANANFSFGSFRLGGASTIDGALQAVLPQGPMSWDLYDSYFSFVNGTRELGTEAVEVDLGAIDIPAAFLALHEGKQLPEWTVSDARGVGVGQSGLAAFRGKWLLIEFWGFW